MKYFKLFILFITMVMLQACPGEDDGIDIINGLTIVNKSDQTIYYDCFEVSKTEINSTKLFFSRLSQLPDNSSYKRCNYAIQQFETGDEKVWVLIYKQSTIDSHSWEEIQEQNLYDKRYSFTLDELNAMNWELVYDGN